MSTTNPLEIKTAIRAGGILDTLSGNSGCGCNSSLPTFSASDLAGLGLRYQPNQNTKKDAKKT